MTAAQTSDSTAPNSSASNSPHRVALVSGGTFGIGRATALGLARQGFEVVLTGRDAARAEETVQAIRSASGNPRVSHLLADFFDPSEVKALAQSVAAQHDRLDVLINNAGGTFSERRLTAQGFERTWALNHLAYVQLTLSLLPLLRSSAPARIVPARIVNVASGLYAGKLDFDNLQGEQTFSVNAAYMQSKLANLLFTYALARRLAGTGVTVNAVNPGIVGTGLGREVTGLNRFISDVLLRPLQKTPEQGAYPSLHMATSPEVAGLNGQFFNKTKFVQTRPVTHDEALQERLWALSLQQLGLTGWELTGWEMSA
jgi:retinol dehydrogenase 12